jgi:nucleotide-binding universal stress UspA family protein
MIDLKRILVPLDGSPLSEEALPLATTLARKHKSQLILLRAWRLLPLPHEAGRGHFYYYSHYYREVELQAYEEAKAYLHAQQAELQAQGFNVRIVLGDTVPTQAIVNTTLIEDIDLIVMATHGRRGLARWLLGSIADEVVGLAACPVLLVRQNKEPALPPRGGKRIPSQRQEASATRQFANSLTSLRVAQLEGRCFKRVQN